MSLPDIAHIPEPQGPSAEAHISLQPLSVDEVIASMTDNLLDVMGLRPEWQNRAACRGLEATFYPPSGVYEPKREKRVREHVAKAICEVCSVSSQCLEAAISKNEPFGVWGGQNEEERAATVRSRRQ